MGGKKAVAENSKKAAGNARKADAANQKKAAEDQKKASEEEKQWSKGSKSNAKKEDAEAKKAEAARKKAERDALIAEEEAAAPSKPKGAGAKTAQKKGRGLDLSQLDEPSKKGSAISASGIDNALDALSLTSKDTSQVERHPERRFKAAYAAFEARRMPEIEAENPGLRRQQRMDLCRKEFEKSEENPFNQVHVAVNASKDEIAAVRDQERSKTERRLGN
ncbi:Coiled-coil domain-containing protein [Penicillium lividum]|nr:Coiled-coil domain-containing protein [Penicillium lividum]